MTEKQYKIERMTDCLNRPSRYYQGATDHKAVVIPCIYFDERSNECCLNFCARKRNYDPEALAYTE